MNMVGVKFQSKTNPAEYQGREYSYYVADGLNLSIGDIVPVSTKKGEGTAMVTRTDVPLEEISTSVMPYMRTIESGPMPLENPADDKFSAEDNFFEED